MRKPQLKELSPFQTIFSLAREYCEPDTEHHKIDWAQMRKTREPTWLQKRLAKIRNGV